MYVHCVQYNVCLDQVYHITSHHYMIQIEQKRANERHTHSHRGHRMEALFFSLLPLPCTGRPILNEPDTVQNNGTPAVTMLDINNIKYFIMSYMMIKFYTHILQRSVHVRTRNRTRIKGLERARAHNRETHTHRSHHRFSTLQH